MFGTKALSEVLSALSAIKESDMSDEDKGLAVALLRDEFAAQSHGAVLAGIVDRLTSPPEVPEVPDDVTFTPAASPKPPKTRRARS